MILGTIVWLLIGAIRQRLRTKRQEQIQGGEVLVLSTTGTVARHRIAMILGVVRVRNIGRDISALVEIIVGGEVSEYPRLLAQSRDSAVQRMTYD